MRMNRLVHVSQNIVTRKGRWKVSFCVTMITQRFHRGFIFIKLSNCSSSLIYCEKVFTKSVAVFFVSFSSSVINTRTFLMLFSDYHISDRVSCIKLILRKYFDLTHYRMFGRRTNKYLAELWTYIRNNIW